jgi:hypothetical protein
MVMVVMRASHGVTSPCLPLAYCNLDATVNPLTLERFAAVRLG